MMKPQHDHDDDAVEDIGEVLMMKSIYHRSTSWSNSTEFRTWRARGSLQIFTNRSTVNEHTSDTMSSMYPRASASQLADYFFQNDGQQGCVECRVPISNPWELLYTLSNHYLMPKTFDGTIWRLSCMMSSRSGWVFSYRTLLTLLPKSSGEFVGALTIGLVLLGSLPFYRSSLPVTNLF